MAIFETRCSRVDIATVFLGYKGDSVRSPREYQRMCNPAERFLHNYYYFFSSEAGALRNTAGIPNLFWRVFVFAVFGLLFWAGA